MNNAASRAERLQSHYTTRRVLLARSLLYLWSALTTPAAIVILTYSYKVRPEYGMTYWRRIKLGFRFWFNHLRMQSGTSWRAHLVMAMKLLEVPAATRGDVVECGCWQGGATVNLSLICAITGRRLRVYDSFEGLPPPKAGDPVAERTFRKGWIPGIYGGTLDQVQGNVRRYGNIDVCSFHPGWFENTLPHHEGAIAMLFIDVDFHASLDDCLVNLWPHLVKNGFLFLDDYKNLPYCAVFFSEKYWAKHFSEAPPGLIGTGTGVQVGMFYSDPSIFMRKDLIQGPESISYCIKGTRALWEYYPDEAGGNGTPT